MNTLKRRAAKAWFAFGVLTLWLAAAVDAQLPRHPGLLADRQIFHEFQLNRRPLRFFLARDDDRLFRFLNLDRLPGFLTETVRSRPRREDLPRARQRDHRDQP